MASPIQYEFGGPAETTVSLGLGVGALVISRDTINLKFKGRLDGKKRRLMGAEIALAAMLLSQTTAKKGSAVDLTAQGQQHEPTLPARSFTPIDRPSWLVQPNEDLVQLATMLFGQPEIGWLIADLNSGSIKQTFINGSRVVELKTDQRIELPVRQDILDFQKIALTCQSDNMITIVDQTAQFSLVALS